MSDEENTSKKKPLNRRSFMATVVGGVTVAGAASTLIAGQAKAQQRPTGRTDSDSGSSSDAPNYGRTGISDSDPNDRPGYGIGSSTTGYSDSDPVDPAGNGRGPGGSRTNITDSDSGSSSDEPNYGRGNPRG